MARFIINNKVYDTEKMEKIGKVKKFYKFGYLLQQFFGENTGQFHECELFRSAKNNWLITHKEGSHICGEAISEEAAKSLLKKYDYEAYARLYGELEEA